MMQEIFDKLRTLQDILSQKYDIEKEISEIPKTITIKKELLNRLKKSYIERNDQLENLKNRIKKYKQNLIDAETERENYEKQMDLIKTQREYEALDKEIKDATEKEQLFRKEILKEEKQYEELTIAIEHEETMITEQEEELKTEQFKIKDESKEKEKLLIKLKKEEEKTIPGLDEEMLFKFERIIKNKSGLGIVPIKNSVCTGCHMMLPAQFENDVRAGEKVLFCPYCSRILFYDETEEGVFLFNEEDSGSLANLDNNEENI